MAKKNPLVFIVDDEPLLLEMLVDHLKEQMPYLEIRTFTTGEACLKEIYDQPDFVILDYYLNSREKEAANGIDILKEIKSRDKDIPVVMLSSQKNYNTAAQTIMYGALHYVIKGQEAFDEIVNIIEANV
jgi:two-component system, OmpR family, response regulator